MLSFIAVAAILALDSRLDLKMTLANRRASIRDPGPIGIDEVVGRVRMSWSRDCERRNDNERC